MSKLKYNYLLQLLLSRVAQWEACWAITQRSGGSKPRSANCFYSCFVPVCKIYDWYICKIPSDSVDISMGILPLLCSSGNFLSYSLFVITTFEGRSGTGIM